MTPTALLLFPVLREHTAHSTHWDLAQPAWRSVNEFPSSSWLECEATFSGHLQTWSFIHNKSATETVQFRDWIPVTKLLFSHGIDIEENGLCNPESQKSPHHSTSLRKQHPLVCGSALWQDQKLLEGRSYILILVDLTHGCTKCEQISHFWMSFFLAMDTRDCCSLRQRCPQDQVLNCTMKRSTQSSHSVLHGIALPLQTLSLFMASSMALCSARIKIIHLECWEKKGPGSVAEKILMVPIEGKKRVKYQSIWGCERIRFIFY